MRSKYLLIALFTTVAAATVAISCRDTPPPIPPVSPSPPSSARAITVDTAPDLVELAQLPAEGAEFVTALAFTPDATELRVVHAKLRYRPTILRHWNVSGKTLLSEYEIGPVGLGAVAFDGAADLIATAYLADDVAFSQEYAGLFGGPTDGVYLFDATTGQLHARLRSEGDGADDWFRGISLSQDGRIVAANGRYERLYVWQVSENRTTSPSLLFAPPRAAESLAFTADFALGPEGHLLAINAGDGRIQLWDVRSQRDWGWLELDAKGIDTERYPIYFKRMAIAPTRQWLAAVSTGDNMETTLTLWRLDERRIQWQTRVFHVHALAFNPSGTLLVAGLYDGLHIWNVETGEEKVIPSEPVYAVTFSADGSLLAWGDDKGTVRLAGLP